MKPELPKFVRSLHWEQEPGFPPLDLAADEPPHPSRLHLYRQIASADGRGFRWRLRPECRDVKVPPLPIERPRRPPPRVLPATPAPGPKAAELADEIPAAESPADVEVPVRLPTSGRVEPGQP